MPGVAILIVDDDRTSQSALRELLDAEGWRVGIVPLASQALPELAGGNWSLVIANVALTGLDGPLFATLKDLAQAAPLENGHARARVLFLVPELAAAAAQPVLESARVPYALKPFHLHDFLEKVSDLLLETSAISTPIRHVRPDFGARAASRKLGHTEREKGVAPGTAVRATNMFSVRGDYQMTEEEITEYEREEAAETLRKKKPKLDPNTGRR